MANFLIKNRSGRAEIASGVLSVMCHLSVPGSVRVELRRPAGDDSAPPETRTTPDRLVVPRPEGTIEIWLVPAQGDRIPGGVAANVQLSTGKADSQDTVQFVELNPGDRLEYLVGTMSVEGDQLHVRGGGSTTESTGAGPGAAAAGLDDDSVALSPGGQLARGVICRAFHADALPDAHRRAVRVVVDGTASLRTGPRRALLETALDVLSGAVSLVARGDTVVQVAGHRLTERTEGPREIGDFSAHVLELFDATPSTIGLDLSDRRVWSLQTDQPTYVYVVTDGVPADIDELRSYSPAGVDWHVVSIAEARPPESVAGHTFLDDHTDQDVLSLVPPAR